MISLDVTSAKFALAFRLGNFPRWTRMTRSSRSA